MTCSEIREYLSAYLDEELADSLRHQVAAHLPQCPVCQAYRDDLLRTQELLRPARNSYLPEGLWERIEAAAMDLKAKKALHRWNLARAASIAAGFVLYLSGYAGLSLWQKTSLGQRPTETSAVSEVLVEAAGSLAGQDLADQRLAWLEERPENRVLEALLEER